MYTGRPVKYPFLQSGCNEIWIFSTDLKKTNIKFHKKIHPMGAELFHANRRTYRHTDKTKLIGAFRDFAKAPKNECWRALQHILIN
jgi:hypothetical protein